MYLRRFFIFVLLFVILPLHYGLAGLKEDLLFEAVKQKDIKKVNQLLREGADVNAQDKSGTSVLIFTIVGEYTEGRKNRKEIVKLLPFSRYRFRKG